MDPTINLKYELDIIAEYIAAYESELQKLTLQIHFTHQDITFMRVNEKFRLCYDEKPWQQLSATDKIIMAEQLASFIQQYDLHMNNLTMRAAKINRENS